MKKFWFSLGSFPMTVFMKIFEMLVLYPISYLFQRKKIFTQKNTHTTIVLGYSVDTLWKFLTNNKNFSRWNVSIDNVFFDIDSEDGISKQEVRILENGKIQPQIIAIKSEKNEHFRRLIVQWASEESRVSLSYNLQHKRKGCILTRKIIYKTRGGGKYQMRKKAEQDAFNSVYEIEEIKKLLSKMNMGNQIYQSILRSPMAQQLSVS